jgi:surface protein
MYSIMIVEGCMDKVLKYKKELMAIVIVLILLLGLSFAWLTLTLNGTKNVVVKSGTLSVVLDDSTSTGISLTNAYSISDEDGLATDPYTFTITNNGTLNSNYTIYLDDNTLETGETRIDDSAIKYNLKEGNATINTALLSTTGTNPNRVLKTGYIKPGITKTYTLRVWIADSADNTAMNKVFRGKLRVEATVGVQDGGTLAAYANDTTSYYAYKASITSITFDKKINVPTDAIASWDVSSASNKSVMAYIVDDGLGTSTYALHIQSNGTTIAPIYCNNLFDGFTKLTTINNLYLLDTSKVIDMSDMFSSCSSLTNLDVSNFDTSQVTTMYMLFYKDSSLTNLELSNFNTIKVTDMSNMFDNCSSLTNLDISNFNTIKVTDMSNMFDNCSSLTNLDISNFDTSQVTNMSYMFRDCSSLTNLNVSNFNTSQVTAMVGMFASCSSLTSLDLSNFDTSLVTAMAGMFENCSSLTNLNLSSFNTSKVVDMSYMFSLNSSSTSDTKGLVSLDISNFDTSSVTDMRYMFAGQSKLTSLNLTNFNTSKVTNMSNMFSGCNKITTLNLISFDTSLVTNMNSMFFNCSAMTAINVSSKWVVGTSTTTTDMFTYCGVSSVTVV